MKKAQWLTLISILLVLIIAILAIINVDKVEVNFIFTTVQWPLILVIIGSALLGALLVICVSFMRAIKEKNARKQAVKAVKKERLAQATTRTEINKLKQADKK